MIVSLDDQHEGGKARVVSEVCVSLGLESRTMIRHDSPSTLHFEFIPSSPSPLTGSRVTLLGHASKMAFQTFIDSLDLFFEVQICSFFYLLGYVQFLD